MQKHKFPITFRDVVFMGAALGPPEHEKYCIDIFTPQDAPHFSTRAADRTECKNTSSS
jgi:hypothetical protein